MKYIGMPFGMWTLFAPSFRKQLTAVFGYDADTAKDITKKAKPKYKAMIRDLPEFEKGDRFKMNLVNCAMIGAFILSMPKRPDVERLTAYYANAMMTKPNLTPALCRLDYTMSEAGGVTDFVRQYTLASGGAYCDCGYKRKKS
mgnify:CR=1 FL=1